MTTPLIAAVLTSGTLMTTPSLSQTLDLDIHYDDDLIARYSIPPANSEEVRSYALDENLSATLRTKKEADIELIVPREDKWLIRLWEDNTLQVTTPKGRIFFIENNDYTTSAALWRVK